MVWDEGTKLLHCVGTYTVFILQTSSMHPYTMHLTGSLFPEEGLFGFAVLYIYTHIILHLGL